MTTTPENNIGKAYGYQYRSFGGKTDQIAELFNGLKNNPTSRRHVVSIWNPNDKDEMALEPCFWGYTFVYINGVLHLDVQSRSSDVVFGLPYNLAFAYFWLLTFSTALGYKSGTINISMSNAHFYENQTPIVGKLTSVDVANGLSKLTTPYCTINKEISSLEDVLSLEWSDISVNDWVRGEKLVEETIEMAV
jgi:thymidylate synthase